MSTAVSYCANPFERELDANVFGTTSSVDGHILAALRSCAAPSALSFDFTFPGTYTIPSTHLLNSDPATPYLAVLPIPTTPLGMGLSFDTSGWRAPTWRAPACKRIEEEGINPTLIFNDDVSASDPEDHFDDTSSLDDASSFDGASSIADVSAFFTDASSVSLSSEDENDIEDDDGMDTDSDYCPRVTPANRPVRPLPARPIPKPAVVSTSNGTQSPTSPSFSPSERNPKRKVECAPLPPKKKIRRTPSLPIPAPNFLAPPPGSDIVPIHYWHLLERGCTPYRGGLLCNIGGCTTATRNYADMVRHVITHSPEQRTPCDGCPATLAREDALLRHKTRRSQCRKVSATRAAYLAEYKQRPDIAAKLRDCQTASSPKERMALNVSLMNGFDKAYAAHLKNNHIIED